jgi:hypothetical protein
VRNLANNKADLQSIHQAASVTPVAGATLRKKRRNVNKEPARTTDVETETAAGAGSLYQESFGILVEDEGNCFLDSCSLGNS